MTPKNSPTAAIEILPLTGLRFVAALYVFIFHIQLRWPLFPESKFLTNFFGQGAVGMSLFFVLSGFVLANRYHGGYDTFKDYTLNRFARIYPVYVTVAVLTLPWIGVDFGAESSYGLIRHALTAALLVLAEIFVVQAWFPQMFHMWNNGGSWSISVEVFCYLLLPFILTKVTPMPNRMLIQLATAAYGLALLPGVVLVLLGGDYLPFYSMPIFRLPEFMMGVCTFEVLRRNMISKRLVELVHVPAIVLLVLYLGLIGAKLPGWISHNWIVLPVIAITIHALTNSSGVLARLLSARLIVWSGHISYSFYSFQIVLLMLLKSHHSFIVAHVPAMQDNRLLLVSAFAALMAMSAFGYHCIEEPCRKWIRRNGAKPDISLALKST